VVVAATDPNPHHAGRGLQNLRRAGVKVVTGLRGPEATKLNESFNHWIVHRTPFVTVKAAMTLDGKIATRTGESKWITGKESRACAMKLRQGSDAILVGINTVLADNPSLTLRSMEGYRLNANSLRRPRRIVLDSNARTPLAAKLVADKFAALTTVVVSKNAPATRVAALRKRVQVVVAPLKSGALDLRWLMQRLGKENVTSLLVEGGGEVNASFLFEGLAHRVAFFYAPKIIGGRHAPKGVAGAGIGHLKEAIKLRDVEYRWLGADLLLSARVEN
jgi:diaminohydroxyphosphoribosylaminopyrimidine deaminase/5-amino-6-(5-phosphoribosylamino)uracil reductase